VGGRGGCWATPRSHLHVSGCEGGEGGCQAGGRARTQAASLSWLLCCPQLTGLKDTLGSLRFIEKCAGHGPGSMEKLLRDFHDAQVRACVQAFARVGSCYSTNATTAPRRCRHRHLCRCGRCVRFLVNAVHRPIVSE
jgi:hypothetical protein